MNTLVRYYNFRLENTRPCRLARELTCFEFLVLTILNQNTSDVLADKALRNLWTRFGRPLIPEVLANCDLNELADLIRVSGMYRRKAGTIVSLARSLLSMGGEDYLKIAPVSEIVNLLRSVKGLGEKSIDVFLLFKRDYPTFPIDTHIRRVCSRLGLSESSSYLRLREYFVRQLGPDVSLLRLAHLVLIHHGRAVCRASSPKCDSCPINVQCRFFLRRRRSGLDT